jgi:hypothetical protein
MLPSPGENHNFFPVGFKIPAFKKENSRNSEVVNKQPFSGAAYTMINSALWNVVLIYNDP